MLTIIATLLQIPTPVLGEDLSSPSFELETGEINVVQQDITPIAKESKPTPTPIVYPKIEPSLTFTLDPDSFVFPKFTASNPEIKTTSLKVKSGKNQGFSLTISQDNSANEKDSKFEFPEFSGDSQDCEAVKTPCSWVTKSTYGLGFRLESPKTEEFKEKTSYKRIPVLKTGDPSGLLIEKNHEGEEDALISLKVNLPKKLLSSNWITTITYTVLPTY